jgi:RNA polymerase sigma-70 factor (ECF subfamily)
MARPQCAGSMALLTVPSTSNVSEVALRNATAADVRDAIEELSVEQRTVIELAYFSGYSHTEIAERLSLPLGTVKGRMRLALRSLRNALATTH